MNEHREEGQVLWSLVRKNQRLSEAFCLLIVNWSIINLTLTLYLFITYECKAGLKWNTGY
jgi:hypothetical protein